MDGRHHLTQKFLGTPTDEGWLYLAIVMDLYSRRIIGWVLRRRMTQQLAVDALVMELLQRRPGPGLIVHSDRGSQYASAGYRKLLKSRELSCHGQLQ